MKEIVLINEDFEGKVDYTRHACRAIIVKETESYYHIKQKMIYI